MQCVRQGFSEKGRLIAAHVTVDKAVPVRIHNVCKHLLFEQERSVRCPHERGSGL